MAKREEWEPTVAFLIDLLGIVTLKSIILGCKNPQKKQAYEKEAEEIINRLNNTKFLVKDIGNFIRAVQVGMLANRLIWDNETKARQGGSEQNHLLPLTHSINGLRMRAGNEIVRCTGGRKDLNLDRLNEELCESFGYNFKGIFK